MSQDLKTEIKPIIKMSDKGLKDNVVKPYSLHSNKF